MPESKTPELPEMLERIVRLVQNLTKRVDALDSIIQAQRVEITKLAKIVTDHQVYFEALVKPPTGEPPTTVN